MSLFTPDSTMDWARTHHVFRPVGGIAGLREIRDPSGRLLVTAFPVAMARQLQTSLERSAACYLLASHDRAYVGESSRAGKRIVEHAADPDRQFVRECYVIHALDAKTLGPSARLYLQCRLIELVEEAGLVRLCNAADARVLPWCDEEQATFERFVAKARIMLFDAGCRAIDSSFASQLPVVPSSEAGLCPKEEQILQELEIPGMEIDVPTAPPPGAEFYLDYCDIWARGYQDTDGRFVVMAGSELRTFINDSARSNVGQLRRELAIAQVLEPIAGTDDYLRLQVAVRFRNAALAAKVVTGAHVSRHKWVPQRCGRRS